MSGIQVLLIGDNKQVGFLRVHKEGEQSRRPRLLVHIRLTKDH